MKFFLIINLVISVIIFNVLAAPFLNKLIPSTSLPTHISDFRNQPRSDSRADKTDSLRVNNNNINKNTIVKHSTVRPKRGVEFYTEILGKVIGTARNGFQRVIRNLDQNTNRNQIYQLNVMSPIKRSQIQKLTNTSSPPRSDEKLTTTTIENVDIDDSTEFSGLTLDNEDEPNVTFESGTYTNDFKKQYFLKILNAIGLYKYGGGDDDKPEIMENTENLSYENNSQQQRVLQSTIEFFQPVVDAWHMWINNFKNMNLSPPSSEHNIFKRFSDNNNNEQLDEVDFTTTVTPSSLSSQILSPLSVIDIKKKVINILPLFFNETSKMKAKLAFENAFYKYSDLVSKGYYNKSTTSDIPLGNDSNLNNTMDFIVNFPVERIDDKNNDGIDDDSNSNGSSSGGGGGDDDGGGGDGSSDGVTNDDMENSNPQNIGIFILEILGTIAGLTWGAVNHFQNMNQQN